MIRKDFTLEDTNDRYEVDVADSSLYEIDEESFLADTLPEAITHLKRNGYKCNRKSGSISKRAHDNYAHPTHFYYAMVWYNGLTVGDPEIVREWERV